MSKIYADYEDKFVKNTIVYTTTEYVYAQGSRGIMAYKDEACTEEYTREELINVCLKGAILLVEGDGVKTYASINSFDVPSASDGPVRAYASCGNNTMYVFSKEVNQ